MVAIAIPASCAGPSACASLKQATYTLYQISRACVLLGVNEIVIYDDEAPLPDTSQPSVEQAPKKIKLDEDTLSTDASKSNSQAAKPAERNPHLIFCANMLQFLITPKHLRGLIFKPIGNAAQFKYASEFGKIPGLVDLDHIAQGIAVPRERRKKLPGQKKLSKKGRKESTQTPYINLGFDRLFKLKNEAVVPVNSKVFVDFKAGKVVESTNDVFKNAGSMGYSVRAVTQFSHIFTQSSLKDGYTQTIYVPSQQFKSQQLKTPLIQQVSLAQIKQKEGLLLVFGKWSEVQHAVSADPDLELDDASALFDGLCPSTERARLEDAIMISLARGSG